VPIANLYWAVPHTFAAAQRTILTDFLDDAERARAQRFAMAADRDAFITAHGVLRLALSVHGDIPAPDWRFARQPSGKPEVAGRNAGGLTFSLAHVRSMVACVVTHAGAVGIDVEEALGEPPDPALIERCCAPSERELLGALAPRERDAAFIELWTIKEAVLKALDTGSSVPFDEIECALNPPRLVRLPARDTPWAVPRVTILRPAGTHVIALAQTGDDAAMPPVAVRRISGDDVLDLPAQGRAARSTVLAPR